MGIYSKYIFPMVAFFIKEASSESLSQVFLTMDLEEGPLGCLRILSNNKQHYTLFALFWEEGPYLSSDSLRAHWPLLI